MYTQGESVYIWRSYREGDIDTPPCQTHTLCMHGVSHREGRGVCVHTGRECSLVAAAVSGSNRCASALPVRHAVHSWVATVTQG